MSSSQDADWSQPPTWSLTRSIFMRSCDLAILAWSHDIARTQLVCRVKSIHHRNVFLFPCRNCPSNCPKQPPPSNQCRITAAASTIQCCCRKKKSCFYQPPLTWRTLIACLDPKDSVVCGLLRSPTDCQARCCLKTQLICPNWPLSVLAGCQQTTLPPCPRFSRHTALGSVYSSYSIMLMACSKVFLP